MVAMGNPMVTMDKQWWTFEGLRLVNQPIMGITAQNMPKSFKFPIITH